MSQRLADQPSPAATGARPSPDHTRTSTPSHNDQKRKRPPPPPSGAWSQPAATGSGTHVMTQITFALDYLKSKDQAVRFSDIWEYLSIPSATEQDETSIKFILRQHPKVEYEPVKASYRFRPMHNVRSADDLIAFLQDQTTAQGIKVNNLKEGWPGALDSIEVLEKDGKLLVTRNRKDNLPKMVWPNDPTLVHNVSNEFKTMWHQVQVPISAGDLRQELLQYGLTPTSQVKAPAKVQQEKKKKRAPRRGGKTTNTHMAGILKDYSHLRR